MVTEHAWTFTPAKMAAVATPLYYLVQGVWQWLFREVAQSDPDSYEPKVTF